MWRKIDVVGPEIDCFWHQSHMVPSAQEVLDSKEGRKAFFCAFEIDAANLFDNVAGMR